jgi:hypothetical protein
MGEAVLDGTSSDHAPEQIALHIHGTMWLRSRRSMASTTPGKQGQAGLVDIHIGSWFVTLHPHHAILGQ